MKIVPLVAEIHGQREIVGEARIDSDGNITGIIKRDHPILTSLISTHDYSFVAENLEVPTSKGNTNGVQ